MDMVTESVRMRGSRLEVITMGSIALRKRNLA